MSGATKTDVLVIGAGQAGLAAARALAEIGVACVVHERYPRIGDSWRRRFDSLTLFTPREISALPGLPQSGEPRGFPPKDEMGCYLERYAARFALPVVAGNGVAHLSRRPKGFNALTDAEGAIEARAVVIATGGFQRPRIPAFAASLSERVQQFDALSYRNPAAIPAGDAIVVGDGATGRQIALELVQSRNVTLAMGRRRLFIPQHILGRDSTALGLRAGLVTADKETVAGRLVRAIDATPGLHLRAAALRRTGISLLPRCVGAQGDELSFADGTRRRCEAVIWALGYRDDTSWLDIEGAATPREFRQARGVAPVPGLYYVGREWQNSRASGLICGVYRDAQVIATHVKSYLSTA